MGYLEPSPGRGHVRQRSSVARIDFSHYMREEQELQVEEPLLDEKDEKHTFVLINRSAAGRNILLGIAWAVSLVLVWACTYVSTRTSQSDALGNLGRGYTTDLYGARAAIKLQTNQFHGSLNFSHRHGFVPPDSPSMKYVGSSLAVDAAWEELTENRYFLLSDAEARASYGIDPATGDPPAKYWNVHHGGWVAGLDAMHTLHCLNHLRTTLYPEVYPQDPQNAAMHGAHCVDHLRQLAMCNVDLTPIPTQWFEGIGQNYINSSRVHTCRNFGAVREWVRERFNGSEAVRARNKDGTPRQDFYAPWSP